MPGQARHDKCEGSLSPLTVIPANAGIHHLLSGCFEEIFNTVALLPLPDVLTFPG